MKPQEVINEILSSLDQIEAKSRDFHVDFTIKSQEMEMGVAVLKQKMEIFMATQKAEMEVLRAKLGILNAQYKKD